MLVLGSDRNGMHLCCHFLLSGLDWCADTSVSSEKVLLDEYVQLSKISLLIS